MAAVYIAHYYPAEDFDNFFRIGRCVEIIGPTFSTYAEAASQIGEELTDIDIQDLPVSAYIIKALPTENGYKVVETYDVEDAGGRTSNGYRAANGRRAGAATTPRKNVFKPFGTFKDDTHVSAKPLLDLTLDESAPEELYSPDDIASKYGAFMARYAPGAGSQNAKRRIPLNKLEKSFRDVYLPAAEVKKRAAAAERGRENRAKAETKISEGVAKKVKSSKGNIKKAIEISKAEVAAIENAVNKGQMTTKEAAPIIAAAIKETEILEILKEFCPQHDEAALLKAVNRIVTTSFGGTPEAKEAADTITDAVAAEVDAVAADAEAEAAAEAGEPAPAAPARKRGRPARVRTAEELAEELRLSLLPKRAPGRPKKVYTEEELESKRQKAEATESKRRSAKKSVTTEEIPSAVAEHLASDPTTAELREGVSEAKELLSQSLDAEAQKEQTVIESHDPMVEVIEMPQVSVPSAEDAREDRLAAEREAEREQLRREAAEEEEADAEYEKEVTRRLLAIPMKFDAPEIDVLAEVETLISRLNDITNNLRDLEDVAPEVASRLPDPAAILRELRDARRFQGSQEGDTKIKELRKRIDKFEKSVNDEISNQEKKSNSAKSRAQQIAEQSKKSVAPKSTPKPAPLPPPPDFDMPDFDIPDFNVSDLKMSPSASVPPPPDFDMPDFGMPDFNDSPVVKKLF